MDIKFDPAKLDRLNDPQRLSYLDPETIWTALGVKKPGVIVDIGAGTGLFALQFRMLAGEGTVYACDIEPQMIAWMEENLPSRYRDSIIPLKMEESRIPLDDGLADAAYLINVYHELEEPAALFRDARRVLAPGGTLAVVDWKAEPTPSGPPLAHRLPAGRAIRDLEAAGFAGVQERKDLEYHYIVTGRKAE